VWNGFSRRWGGRKKKKGCVTRELHLQYKKTKGRASYRVPGRRKTRTKTNVQSIGKSFLLCDEKEARLSDIKSVPLGKSKQKEKGKIPDVG